jgi:chromosome partitioning protein
MSAHPRQSSSHCITLVNEKGGTGKSTLAVHLLVALQARGHQVAAVDLDFRQRTLSRYLENRARHQPQLPAVKVVVPSLSELDSRAAAGERDCAALNTEVDELARENEFVIIDCPGSDSPRTRLAMTLANTLITPLNDSFVDLDLLGQVEPANHQAKRLGFFAEAIWQARQQRALSKQPALDWVVVRNRLTMLDARNKRRVNAALEALQGRVACRYVSGLAERVIYRELFPAGLTLLDMSADSSAGSQMPKMTTSHLAARQELRNFINALNLPEARTTQGA